MNVVEQPTSKSKKLQTPLDLVEFEDHPKNKILGDPLTGVKTWSQLENLMSHLCFTSKFEPQCIDEAFSDDDWINAMQEELNQFTYNEVCNLVPGHEDKNVIGSKWIFINKVHEHGNIVRNKAGLVV